MLGLYLGNELLCATRGPTVTFPACCTQRWQTSCLRVVLKIITSAVEIEKEFVLDALPVELIGMNSNLICSSTSSSVMTACCKPSTATSSTYKAENPFEWMEVICLNGKTCFFEKKTGEYAKQDRYRRKQGRVGV